MSKAEAKQRILECAEQLFFRFGIRSVSMDDIARHLGMSKKTIYIYYKDKKEVVKTLMKAKIKEDEEMFTSLSANAANFVEEVMGGLKCMSDIFSQMNPNVFYDLQKYHPDAWLLFTKFKTEFILNHVRQSIERGKHEGLVRENVNTAVLAKMCIEQIEMGFNPNIFPPDKFKMVDVQIALFEHFLYGICTLKGHKLFNKYKHIVEDE